MEGGESDRANRSNRANGSNRSNRVSEKAIAEGGGSQAIHGHPGYIMCDALALYEIGQGRHTVRSNRSNRISEKAIAEGEALKRSTDIPQVHHVRRPCPIRDRTGASYYLLHCEGIDPRGGEPSLTRGEGYSVGTATRALPAETALMLLPLTQEEPRKKCASPSLG